MHKRSNNKELFATQSMFRPGHQGHAVPQKLYGSTSTENFNKTSEKLPGIHDRSCSELKHDSSKDQLLRNMAVVGTNKLESELSHFKVGSNLVKLNESPNNTVFIEQ